MQLYRHRKYLITGVIAAISFAGAFAQRGSGLYNQADDLYKAKHYYEATQVFEKYLSSEKNARPHATPFAIEKKVKGKANVDPHQEAVYMLANSYRMVNDYQKAEKYYKEAVGYSEAAYPDARFWYAVTLRANQNYGEALTQITAFLEKHQQLDSLLISADRELEDLKFIQLQGERVNDQFVLTEIKGGSANASYALQQKSRDSVAFTAVREQKTKEGQVWYMNELFESEDNDNPLAGASSIDIPKTIGVHDGMASFTNDGKAMFFTRWTKKNNQTTSEIYVSRMKEGSWSTPERAPEPINEEGANSAQPYLTQNGRYVIFSSNRPGGSGGYDLWAASLDSNLDPIQLRNLGNIVNTTGDEEAPYFHDKTRTLVFSSNGRVGMGGFDLYYAKGSFNLISWEKPVNAGAPLNSSKDDLYYTSSDEDNLWNTGWVSSDRSSECCLALFSVKQNNAQYINGRVIDCDTKKSLSDVVLTVTDLRHPGRVLGKYAVDTAGAFAIQLHNSAHFNIRAEHTGYDPGSVDYNLQLDQPIDSQSNQVICLKPFPTPAEEVDNLLKALTRSSRVGNFAYKKAVLSDSAHDNLDSLAKMLSKYPDMVIQVEGYTDGIGSVKYNIGLAQRRVDACIRYLVKIGVSPKQLVGKAMGKCCPIAPETIDGQDNPAGREINRRVEYKVIKQ